MKSHSNLFFMAAIHNKDPIYLHLSSWERVENALDEIADIRRLVEPSDEQNARYRYLLHCIAVDVFLMEHIFDKGT